MNYGAEPADQVVRYSLEGMEYSLKITGNVAKHVAIFIAAALKDQKKTRGKTRLTRMLKDCLLYTSQKQGSWRSGGYGRICVR